MFNSCHGNDAEVLFNTITQFLNTLALYVIQILVSRKYFQSYLGKYSSLHVCTIGQQVDGWIVWHIESITDTFSPYLMI